MLPISAIFSLKRYATNDRAWLSSIGFPLVKGIANFYLKRVAKRGNGFDFNGVMGPDEYAFPVNNSACESRVFE